MKRTLFAALGAVTLVAASQSASAADLPIKAPAMTPVVAPVFNWSGWYVGGHIGYGWGDKTWTFPGTPIAIDYGVDGFLAGGQVGFNIQSGPWVWGLEADISWTNIEGSTSFLTSTYSTDVNWLSTLTGRLGYAAGPALFYVKGGGAWADEDHAVTPVFRGSETRSGWTVGLGYEYDFGNNWSAKLEYSYIDFGKDRVTFTPGAEIADIDQDMHVVKWGINYRFATGKMPVGKTPPAPVVTKY